MTEERKYAILFAATLLCARKLNELDSDKPGEGGSGRERNQPGCIHSAVHRQEVAGEMSYGRT